LTTCSVMATTAPATTPTAFFTISAPLSARGTSLDPEIERAVDGAAADSSSDSPSDFVRLPSRTLLRFRIHLFSRPPLFGA
jgi:hypothetical protein